MTDETDQSPPTSAAKIDRAGTPMREALAPHVGEDPWHDESVELVLKMKHWGVVAVATIAMLTLIPWLGKQWEVFAPSDDYRQPKALSEDYWQYQRWLSEVVQDDKVLLLGDSAVWGEFARPSETWTSELNQLAGRARFANGGLKGLHPLAMHGLVEHVAPSGQLAGVVLHFNPIWMTSPQRDLSVDERVSFNHPMLLPQFSWDVPAFQATWDQRCSNALSVRVPVWRWTSHVQMTSFERLDIPRWTLLHPRAWPLSQLRRVAPLPLDEPSSQMGRMGALIRPKAYNWVPVEDSLQFQAFLLTVQSLQSRRRPVFCWVGGLSPERQTEASRASQAALLEHLEAELDRLEVPWLALPIESKSMADASHPTPAGYRQQAAVVWQNNEFQDWLSNLDLGEESDSGRDLP